VTRKGDDEDVTGGVQVSSKFIKSFSGCKKSRDFRKLIIIFRKIKKGGYKKTVI